VDSLGNIILNDMFQPLSERVAKIAKKWWDEKVFAIMVSDKTNRHRKNNSSHD
jgi:hypothetical protein